MMTATEITLISIPALLVVYVATYNLRYKLWKRRLDKLINELKSSSELRTLNNAELRDLNNNIGDIDYCWHVVVNSLAIDTSQYAKICEIIPEYRDINVFYKRIYARSEQESHLRYVLSQLESYCEGIEQ